MKSLPIFFFLVALLLWFLLYHVWLFTISATRKSSQLPLNIIGILFAFLTNDTIVFKQERRNCGQPAWLSFFLARLSTLGLDVLLTYIFVTTFPDIIGQFVEFNIDRVNTIETILAQILIIILNYIFSKIYIFKGNN